MSHIASSKHGVDEKIGLNYLDFVGGVILLILAFPSFVVASIVWLVFFPKRLDSADEAGTEQQGPNLECNGTS